MMKMKTENKPLAIFDLDGTIYKTESVSLAAIHSAIIDKGLEDKSDEEIKSLFGFTTPELCTALFPNIGQELLNELFDQVRYYERSLISQRGELYEGIENMLHELRTEGWSLAICTNGSQVYVNAILDGLELRTHFDFVCIRDGVHTKTEHIRNLKKKHNTCIMIGDKASDIAAATANSIPSIGVTWGYGTKEEIINAPFIAEHVKDIKGILCRIRIYEKICIDLQRINGKESKATIVGINGVDTAGKTRFSEEFNSFLISLGMQTLCVHLDDFHNEAKKRSTGGDEIHAYIENAFNLGLLEEKILKPFHSESKLEEELTMLDLNEDTFTQRKHYQASPGTVLLIEGTLLFREPIDKYFSYRIFLDISFDEVMKRAEIRDVPRFGHGIIEKYERKYIPIQKWYLTEKKPKERANIVIENNDFLNPKTAMKKTGQVVLTCPEEESRCRYIA